MAKKSRIKTVSGALVGLGAAGLTAGSSYLASYTVNGKRQTLPQSFAWQKAHYDVSWYDQLEKRYYTISSYDGYTLHVQLCRNPSPSDRYVIITHGYTDNRMGALKYMKLYLDRGYHCIIHDLRGHGENEKAPCTYSINEGKDLYELIRDTRSRYPDLRVLGLHGESLGASTTVACLGLQIWAKTDGLPVPYVDFAVPDCGFADITNVLEGAVGASLPFPRQLVACAGAAAKLRYGYAFSEMKPINALAENDVPLLFIHGAADTFITPDNSRRMAAATRGYREYHLIPGARHAQSVLTDPALYRRHLYAFLDQLGC